MTAPATSYGPIASAERISSVDILRGASLLGILLMNIVGFGLMPSAYDDPTVQGGAAGWDLRVWLINAMFFEGSMRAMFSMLFGAGAVMLTLRMEARGGGIEVADIYYRRTILLLLFGAIHAYFLLWLGDILYAYGLFGLFLFPFRRTAVAKLIIVATVFTFVGVGLRYYRYTKAIKNFEFFEKTKLPGEGMELPANIRNGKDAWEELVENMKPSAEKIQEEMDKKSGGYFGLVVALAPANRMTEMTANYDFNPWDVLPMMMLGMALYRLKVITAELNYRSYLIMILVGYGIGLSVNYYEAKLVLNDHFSVPSLLKSGLTYPFGRIGMAIGHIGIVMIFCKSNFLPFLKKAFAAVGKMALTNYIMHSVICGFIFLGVGFSMFGKLQRHELYYVVIAIWIFQLIASPIWLKYFRFGPLEWCWRSLTYKRIMPFKINHKAIGSAVVEV